MPEMLAFIGTYTSKGSRGIYSCKLDLDSGELKLGKSTPTENPSYLTIEKKKGVLYAVNEIQEFEGQKTGTISAFAFDRLSGDLKFLNRKTTQGSEPAYVAVDKTGNYVAAANYRSGSVCIFPISTDGSLGQMSSFTQHMGNSINLKRQEGPHAHCAIFNCENNRVYVSDLGLDKILIYDFNQGQLGTQNAGFFKAKSGFGPRHLVFSQNCRYAYLSNELNSSVTALKVLEDGSLKEIQTLSSKPPDYREENACSDIHLGKTGKLLYASNRGHNSIAIFEINLENGMLEAKDIVPTEGKMPRAFRIDPTGKFLLVANMESNEIVSFNIDPKSGKLLKNGCSLEVPTPTCIVFADY